MTVVYCSFRPVSFVSSTNDDVNRETIGGICFDLGDFLKLFIY
jgi:hypothetical protein